jgi:hypothetical protein
LHEDALKTIFIVAHKNIFSARKRRFVGFFKVAILDVGAILLLLLPLKNIYHIQIDNASTSDCTIPFSLPVMTTLFSRPDGTSNPHQAVEYLQKVNLYLVPGTAAVVCLTQWKMYTDCGTKCVFPK